MLSAATARPRGSIARLCLARGNNGVDGGGGMGRTPHAPLPFEEDTEERMLYDGGGRRRDPARALLGCSRAPDSVAGPRRRGLMSAAAEGAFNDGVFWDNLVRHQCLTYNVPKDTIIKRCYRRLR